jgi:hypothetical protein
MDRAGDILRSPSFWVAVLGLLGLLALGFGLFLWIRRWATDKDTEVGDLHSELEHYRQLRDKGELSDQEFEEILRLVVQRKDAGQEPREK